MCRYAKFVGVGVQVGKLCLRDAFAIGVDPGLYVFKKPLREQQAYYCNVDLETRN